VSAALAKLQQIPARVAAVADWETLARDRVEAPTWAYLDGGAGDGLTRADNRAAFDRLQLAPRLLADVAGGHTRVTLLGSDFAHPILLAPVAHQTLAHPDGELASARAAAALQAGMVVSTLAGHTLEAIAAVAGAPLWFQLYLLADRDATLALVRRAEAAGYRALVLTVDAPLNAGRHGEQRAGFALPPDAAANLRGLAPAPGWSAQAGGPGPLQSPLLQHAARWADVRWLQERTTLPLLLKGILRGDDARRALDHGAAGLIVSNHGGRALDGVPASIDALPAVAAAVAGRAPLLLDGGIRRGTDVLKARALGADAVLIGRAALHGLAAAGAPGVAHVLHLLRTELETAMAMCGCRTLADIGPDLIWNRS
jgi:4-hydroxymandelate oxidase